MIYVIVEVARNLKNVAMEKPKGQGKSLMIPHIF